MQSNPDSDNPIPETCDYCGCQLILRAQRHTSSLATPEQRTAARAEVGTAGDWKTIQALLAEYGTRELWALAYRCPGCGSHGTDYANSYPTPEEAEAVIDAQNRLAGTPEARAQAARWEEEVARRAEHDARALAALFPLRFPQWADRVPEPGAQGSEDPDESRYSLVIRLLSEHPSVKEPLMIRVRCGEVLVSWVHGWHEHVFRQRPSELADVEHLHRALDVVAQLVSEQIAVIALYRGEQLASGGSLQQGTDPSTNYLRQLGPGGGDRFIIVSWRGTDDREILRPVG